MNSARRLAQKLDSNRQDNRTNVQIGLTQRGCLRLRAHSLGEYSAAGRVLFTASDSHAETLSREGRDDPMSNNASPRLTPGAFPGIEEIELIAVQDRQNHGSAKLSTGYHLEYD